MASDSPSDQVRPDADVVVGLRLAARVEFFVFARPLHDEVLAPARMNERDIGVVIEDSLCEIAPMKCICARAGAGPLEHALQYGTARGGGRGGRDRLIHGGR